MKNIKLLFFLLFFFQFIWGFVVLDDGVVVNICSGDSEVKYISIANFSEAEETISIEIAPQSYSQKDLKILQKELISIEVSDNVIISENKEKLLPVFITADRNADKGRYFYWLKFCKIAEVKDLETIVVNVRSEYNLPLVIDVDRE